MYLFVFVNSSILAGSREEASAKASEEIRSKEDFSKVSGEAKKNFEEAEKAAADQIDFIDATMLNISAGLSRLMGNEAMATAIEISKIGKETQGKAAAEALQKAKTEGVEKVFGAKPDQTSIEAPKFATGGIITKRIDNATIGEAGKEAVIPLESSIGRKILNLDRESITTPNNDIANSIVTLIDKISTTIPTITPSASNISILPENNIKPSVSTTNQISTANTNTTVDNSQVIAAINRLTETIAANGNKEITLEMNGETVGKVLTPIMSTPMVRQINNTSVLT